MATAYAPMASQVMKSSPVHSSYGDRCRRLGLPLFRYSTASFLVSWRVEAAARRGEERRGEERRGGELTPDRDMAASSALRVILGSSSASRRLILSEMGYQFTLLSADIDEMEIRKEKPEELVVALAHAKADAILEKMKNNGMMKEILDSQDTTLMITADQVVVHDGAIREKPSSPEEARRFIKGYSESHAATIGSVLVTNVKTGARREGWDKAEVYFHKIPDEVVESLIEEGNVFYVAGGLLVEHPLTSPLVEAIVGTIDSVMGLPKALTEKLIKESLSEP